MALDCYSTVQSFISVIKMADNNMKELVALGWLRCEPKNRPNTQAGTNIQIQVGTRLCQIGDSAIAMRQEPNFNARVIARANSIEIFVDKLLKLADGVEKLVDKLLVLAFSVTKLGSKLLMLVSTSKAPLTMCSANITAVLIAAANFAAIYYIEQCITIQLEYDLETLQNAAERYRLQQT
jgi:hypothetical protein